MKSRGKAPEHREETWVDIAAGAVKAALFWGILMAALLAIYCFVYPEQEDSNYDFTAEEAEHVGR